MIGAQLERFAAERMRAFAWGESDCAAICAEWVALQGGALIQDALPTRDADFRELVKSGIHPSCWAEMFSDEEDDDDAP